MTRFYVENFGCRASQADGAAIEHQFVDRGLERASAAHEAEIVVLNTCTVTDDADKDARSSIRRLQRDNPGCRILVTGCYAQRAPHELAALPGVTWVVGNSHKHQVAEIATTTPRVFTNSAHFFVPLANVTPSQLPTHPSSGDDAGNIVIGDIFAHTELMAASVFEAANERTRPILKIQDGCDNRCSFCVIPSVRGRSRSLPASRVIQEVQTLVGAGYREVVISGINLGRWGRDLKEVSDPSADVAAVNSGSLIVELERQKTNNRRLPLLIQAILEQTLIEKLRISSVEPMDWSDQLIDFMAASGRIAKHAHVPLQSGSDAVLRRMRRKYRPWHYREKILKIRMAMPTAAIGADVMVGFPGETDAEFDETRCLIEQLPFTYLHVFTYSMRPGTPAAEASNQIPGNIAKERSRILREIASKKRGAFMRSLVDTVIPAITFGSGAGGRTEALSDNYLKVSISGRQAANCWTNVRVEGVDGDILQCALEKRFPYNSDSMT